MTSIITWALTLFGPIWAVARPLLPALSALKSAGIGVLVAALVAGGAWGVWQLRHWAEADGIADKAQAIVDRANLKTENAALKAAAKHQAATLKDRDDAIEAGKTEFAKLKQEMKEKRDASPDPDTVVVPAGDPWLGPPTGGLPKRPRS